MHHEKLGKPHKATCDLVEAGSASWKTLVDQQLLEMQHKHYEFLEMQRKHYEKLPQMQIIDAAAPKTKIYVGRHAAWKASSTRNTIAGNPAGTHNTAPTSLLLVRAPTSLLI